MRVGFRRLVWGVASVALIAGAGISGPAWADPPEEPHEVAEVLSRPDWVSAAVTARSLGERVEVLSEKSETGQTWVHPNGPVEQEQEQAAGAVRFVDEGSGEWREIDTTLRVTADGRGPVSMPVDVAGEPVVVFDAGAAGEVKLGLPDVVLPTPILDGPTALYPNVLAGVDLSVEVHSAGFEVLWIVKTLKAADALMAESDWSMVKPFYRLGSYKAAFKKAARRGWRGKTCYGLRVGANGYGIYNATRR